MSLNPKEFNKPSVGLQKKLKAGPQLIKEIDEMQRATAEFKVKEDDSQQRPAPQATQIKERPSTSVQGRMTGSTRVVSGEEETDKRQQRELIEGDRVAVYMPNYAIRGQTARKQKYKEMLLRTA